MITNTFEVCEEHIKLLKNMYTSWNYSYFGSPAIDPKRPFGDSLLFESMAKILGIKGEIEDYRDWELSRKQTDELLKLYQEMETVLQILLFNCSIKPGIYENVGYSNEWNLKTGKNI